METTYNESKSELILSILDTIDRFLSENADEIDQLGTSVCYRLIKEIKQKHGG